MLATHFRFTWRNLRRNPSQSAISLGSLILGLTFFFLISFWVRDELSYDTGYPDASRICRVETQLTQADGTSSALPTVGWPVGRALVAEYPQIGTLTYMRSWSPIISSRGAKFYETAFYADSNFFRVFDFQLEEGNPATALTEPHSLVISNGMKEKYFGKEGSAIGKILMLADTVPYKVTGVFKEPSTPSHLRFDMLGSFSGLVASNPKSFGEEFASGWFDVNVYNYIKLRRPATAAGLTALAKDLILRDGKAAVAAAGMKSTLLFRPVSEIYLYSGLPTGTLPVGDIRMVRLFVLIGLFILLIACLNFVNLTTARSVERAREIGIKKVLGCGRRSLIGQFLLESAWLCLIASIISIAILLFLLPAFNSLTGKHFTIASIASVGNLLLLLSIVLVVIPVSGLYPAFVLSSFKPVKVLKGRFSHTSSGNFLRKALVVTQFAISIGFILGTIVIWNQMKFMQAQALGFDKNQIVLINTNKIPWTLGQQNAETYKTSLLAIPGVSSVTACGAVPGRAGWEGQFAYPEGKTKDQGSVVEYIPVDRDYLKTLGLSLVAGRDFFPDSKEDQENNTIVNESAVRSFGWGSPANAIGKKLSTSGKEGIVVGVVRDYHQHSLHEQIGPVVLGIGRSISLLAVRYDGHDPGRIVDGARADWDGYFKGYGFDFRFMSEDFQAQYKKDDDFETLFGVAACLAIAIACIGLLGLAAYSTRTKLKEIGVRKVLGASAFRITRMLSRETVLLVVTAVLIASPVAWICMEAWLRQFAYKTGIEWWIFPLAAVAAIAIALATIAFTTIRAALSNPVTTLRSE
jgi:putative ABC transport system permease protein